MRKQTVFTIIAAVFCFMVLGGLLTHTYLQSQSSAGPSKTGTKPRTAAGITSAASADCAPNVNPIGQAKPSAEPEPYYPVWCATLQPQKTTRATADNTWEDQFNTDTPLGRLDDKDFDYRVFNAVENSDSTRTSRFFINNNHWMADTAGGQMGGALMRPNTTFKAENGALIIEADVAAGITNYEDSGSVEIDVNSAAEPTGKTVDNLYGYGLFGGKWSFGCRFQADRRIFCALYRPDATPGNPAVNGNEKGRVWQMSDFQNVGKTHFHADPKNEGGKYWRLCQDNEMDLNCRDRFRLELRQDSVIVYVNGYKYFEQSGFEPANKLPADILNGPTYVYFTNWTNRPRGGQAYRFHWDRLAINPHDKDRHSTQPSASPSYQSMSTQH